MWPAENEFNSVRTALLSAVAILLLAFSGIIERTDRWWFDSLQSFSSSSAPLARDTALVMIDERSLTAMGEAPFAMRWPWPRAAFAALLTGLHTAGAERIVVDLIFFEHSTAAEQDLLLGALAAGMDNVILATVPDRLPVFWPEAYRKAHPELFEKKSKWGLVRSIPDADSVIRSYTPQGSLAQAAIHSSLRENFFPDQTILLRWRGNMEQLRARGVTMVSAAPFVIEGWNILDEATQSNADFDPAGLAAAVSKAPAPAGEIFTRVSGKTVFVGANAAATFDSIATPLGAPEPGVILQWNAFANLQWGDYIKAVAPAWSWAFSLAVIIALSLAGRAGLSLRRPALVALAILAAVTAGTAGLFYAGAWFSPSLPVVAVIAAFTAVAAESFRVEQHRKREIQGWFGAYVSPAVVDRLVADPHAVELGGELRELTILFSDIAGFTTISEGLPPDELVLLINRFLENQTERIIDHGGYLDKYIGDAIMAVFGSPEELDNHALEACRAALACRTALEALNDEIEAEFGIRLGMRTGINTGEAVVGNVGSTRKRNYTVLGDSVNLASRLEGANKQTGTLILLGPVTAANVRHEMLLRPVARLQVKGKTEAVEVFELVAEKSRAAQEQVAFTEAFTKGFQAYCSTDFAEASELFALTLELRPGDELSKHYLQQSHIFKDEQPGPDWQAILKLETK